jgi:hypothetical protein
VRTLGALLAAPDLDARTRAVARMFEEGTGVASMCDALDDLART